MLVDRWAYYPKIMSSRSRLRTRCTRPGMTKSEELAARFKKAFGRKVKIDFLGVWFVSIPIWPSLIV